MNVYFISNKSMEQSAERLSTYINRIAFGHLSHRSAVWMKNTTNNLTAYKILDRELKLSEKQIPCYHGLLLPEDLLWKNLEHLFIIGSPEKIMHEIGLLLPEDGQKFKMTVFPQNGWVYMMSVKRIEDNRLYVEDLGFYYKAGNH